MYLKRIDLFGFKSFQGKTELEFGSGISAIIGPNGCGKSNLVDAVRWALGEQSVKSLRGVRMDEIIFAGTEQRKPLNFAEIALTFSEAGPFLKLDYEEVTVTRRLYRSGESEYYINKAPCRLKDITELFLDTGVGKDFYSIIGQGRIEELINSRPEERREIFEEAAGILKYKLRKKEARRRLDETKENMVRVEDLIYELKSQVEPLKAEAALTRRYRELYGQMQAAREALLAYEIRQTEAQHDKVARQLMGVAGALAAAQAEGGRREERLLEVKMQQQAQLSLLAGEEQRLGDYLRETEHSEAEQRLLREREGHLGQQQQSCRSRHEQIKLSLTRAEEQIETITEAFRRKGEEIRSVTERCRALEHSLEQLEQSYLMKELEQQQQQLLQSFANREAQAEALVELERQLSRMRQRPELLAGELREQSARLRWLRRERETLRKDQLDSEAALPQLEAEESVSAKAVGELKARFEELSGVEQSLRDELKDSAGRLQLLQEQEADLSGYYRGVREVLKASRQPGPRLEAIVAPVADLISVERPYERAVEVALGGGSQYIVTQTEEAAKKAIAYLKAGSLGWATFLPLDTIRVSSSALERYPRWREIAGAIARASELAGVEQRYQKVVEYLIGSTVICKDLEAASKLARFVNYSCRVITLDGDAINPGGAIHGGSIPKRSAGLPLGRRREIEQLQQKSEDLRRQITSAEEAVSALRAGLSGAEKKLAVITEQRKEMLDRLKRLDKERQDRLKEEQLLRERISGAVLTRRELEAKQMALRQQIAGKQQQLEQLKAEINLLQATFKAKQETYRKSLSEVKEIERELTDKRVARSSLQQQELALREKLENALNERKNQQADQKQREQEEEQLAGALSANQAEQQQIQVKLRQLRNQVSVTVSEVTREKERASALLAELADLEHAEKLWRSRCQKLEKSERRLSMEQARLETEISYQSQHFRELFGDQPAVSPEAGFDPAEAGRRIELLKEELADLGNVNLGAIEELARLEERINFLMGQQEDLQKGALSLQKVLNEIDKQMIAHFNRSFAQIDSGFQVVFSELFSGGRAVLSLTDPGQVLDSGIEINAQPPGKKLQNISLLSSGEKVLTALALTFAILKYKPAPFYLLDEIESALDDVNLDRFVRYLKKASSQAQFILITHRKRTMEAADTLYGVTMPEPGISKVISLKLEEIAS